VADVSEIQEAKKWIRATLSANADITGVVSTRIYADRAPGPPFPYIVYNFMGGTDVQGLGINRQQTQPLFQVRVVTDGPPNNDARKVDKRLDDLLQAATHSASGDYIFAARREQPIDRVEVDAATNHVYHNLGGLYRLWIRRAP
jgi:hypothetical protein